MALQCHSCGTELQIRRRGHCPVCGAAIHARSPGESRSRSERDEHEVLDDVELLEEAHEGPAGVWSDGRYLVMWKEAQLPDICVKSNQPADGKRLRRNLSWHHPAVFLAIFAGLLIYVVLALVLRKTATIHIGLSEEWIRRRRRAIAVGWLSVLAGIGMVFVGAAQANLHDAFAWLIPAGLLVALFGAILGIMQSRMVAPIRITDEYVWLKGVHPDYVGALPRFNRARL